MFITYQYSPRMLISVIWNVSECAIRIMKFKETLDSVMFTRFVLVLVVMSMWILYFILKFIFRRSLKF